MALRVKTNGFDFTRFISYDIDSSLDTLADGFSFVIGNPQGVHAGQILEGKVVQIFDGAIPIMIGETDDVVEGEEIHVHGRDLMIRAIENDAEHDIISQTVTDPVAKIIELANKVGLTKIDRTGITSKLSDPLPPSLQNFQLEAGESFAEAMVKLADAGKFYIWLDRLGILHLSNYHFEQKPAWDFYNRKDGSNCHPIKRRKSAANLKAEILAFGSFFKRVDSDTDTFVNFAKVNDQALIRAGFNRKKTLLDNRSFSVDEAQRKLDKLMAELKMRGKEWEISYEGPHIRGGEIPEVGKVATVTSYFSGVNNLSALIASVTLKKDEQGTVTSIILREKP